MTAHTKGPWEWAVKDGNAFLVPAWHEDAKSYPETCAIIDDGSAYGEYTATIKPDSPDAKLIAAAPDLLEALEAVLETCENCGDDAYLSAIAAIAKAKGELPALMK